MAAQLGCRGAGRSKCGRCLRGGAAGAAVRWGIVESLGHDSSSFPWALLGVNTAGSLLLGAVVFVAAAGDGRELLSLGLGVGFCGSFTTFLSFAVIAAELGRDGDIATAVIFVVASVAAAVAAVIAGGSAARRTARNGAP